MFLKTNHLLPSYMLDDLINCYILSVIKIVCHWHLLALKFLSKNSTLIPIHNLVNQMQRISLFHLFYTLYISHMYLCTKKINFKLRINKTPMSPMFFQRISLLPFFKLRINNSLMSSVKGMVRSLCGTLQWKLFSVPDDSFLLQVIMVPVTALCDENAPIWFTIYC